MRFKPISIEAFVAQQKMEHPHLDAEDLTRRLRDALDDYEKEKLCECGNDIWVIGSAFAGNGCYHCITGETDCTDTYEIDSALFKRYSPDGRRHLDIIPDDEVDGIFDEDSYEVTDIPLPLLCTTCEHHLNPDKMGEAFCKLMQADAVEGEEFVCREYVRGE